MTYTPLRPDPNAPPVRVNLYSDTQTRPTPAMKQAMMEAETGDEQSGLDPTINELCDRMAALMGTEAAVFLPSGTMCNQIAIRVHCTQGDAILAHKTAHILTSEGGGVGALTGAQIMGLEGEGGIFAPETLESAIAMARAALDNAGVNNEAIMRAETLFRTRDTARLDRQVETGDPRAAREQMLVAPEPQTIEGEAG